MDIETVRKTLELRKQLDPDQLYDHWFDVEYLLGEIDRLKEDSVNYHKVMNLLRNTKLKHGRCRPVEDNACTHCGAKIGIDEMLDRYKGNRLVQS